jgi:hypothetical protein
LGLYPEGSEEKAGAIETTLGPEPPPDTTCWTKPIRREAYGD